MPERLLQEAGEGFGRHLADPHGELAMADPAKPRDMAVDRHVVGRVGEDEIRPFIPHQHGEDGPVPGIPADQAMAAEAPHVAGPRDGGRRIAGCKGDVLRLGRTVRGALMSLLENDVDLGGGEAGELDVELDVDEALQLDRQQIPVPAGIERELIVGQYVGTSLRRIEVGEAHGGDAFQAQQPGGLDPAVTRDDLAIPSDQHRVGKTKPANTLGNLPDLLPGMGPGITRIRPQATGVGRFDSSGRDDVRCRGL
jgi:hypothetical protein